MVFNIINICFQQFFNDLYFYGLGVHTDISIYWCYFYEILIHNLKFNVNLNWCIHTFNALTRWRKAQIVFHINLVILMFIWRRDAHDSCSKQLFLFGMLSVLICDLSPNFNRYDFIIKLSWVKLCRQLFLFKLSFANYFLCYEPCIILYEYLCRSKLFCVLLLILLLSFKRHIYDVFGRSNCFNILMTKKLHLWTIRRLQGT